MSVRERDKFTVNLTIRLLAAVVNVVSRTLKLVVTTAHDHTLSTMLYGQIEMMRYSTVTKVELGHHSHLVTGATHSTRGGQH